MRHLILLSLLALTGCIGTSSKIAKPNAAPASSHLWYTVNNADGMSPEGLAILKERLDSRLSRALVAPGTADAVHVKVTITNYYMRNGAARFLVGIMAGKDSIKSLVQVIDPTTGKELGQLLVDSGNATAFGTSRGLLEGHANEIADFVLAGNTATSAPSPTAQPQEEMKWRPRTR